MARKHCVFAKEEKHHDEFPCEDCDEIADAVREAVERCAEVAERNGFIGTAFEIRALLGESEETHPTDCLCDACVRLENGVLVHRDGTPVEEKP